MMWQMKRIKKNTTDYPKTYLILLTNRHVSRIKATKQSNNDKGHEWATTADELNELGTETMCSFNWYNGNMITKPTKEYLALLLCLTIDKMYKLNHLKENKIKLNWLLTMAIWFAFSARGGHVKINFKRFFRIFLVPF